MVLNSSSASRAHPTQMGNNKNASSPRNVYIFLFIFLCFYKKRKKTQEWSWRNNSLMIGIEECRVYSANIQCQTMCERNLLEIEIGLWILSTRVKKWVEKKRKFVLRGRKRDAMPRWENFSVDYRDEFFFYFDQLKVGQ